MSVILFFIFASCEPLRPIIRFCVNHGRKFQSEAVFTPFYTTAGFKLKLISAPQSEID